MCYLGRKTLAKELGFVLQTVFKTEDVLGILITRLTYNIFHYMMTTYCAAPTRGIIYWSLGVPSTVNSLLGITRGQRDHYCGDTKGLLQLYHIYQPLQLSK